MIVFTCLATFACTSTPENAAPAITNAVIVDLSTLNPNQLVPAAKTIEWKKNYENFFDSLRIRRVDSKGDTSYVSLTENELVKGFTFRTSDLLAALGINSDSAKSKHIRGYFGIDSSGNRKMFFVAAINANLDSTKNVPLNAGSDRFFRNKKSHIIGGDDSDVALDLNYPCPTLCPDNGAVATANKPKR